MAPSMLNIKTKGILNTKNNAIDNTISFCSWRFFIILNLAELSLYYTKQVIF